MAFHLIMTRVFAGALLMSPLIVGPLASEFVLPAGWDSFRIENWPVLRPLMRTTMPSTYDRAGGNEGSDASHFLYQVRDDFNVTAHVMGEGWLAFARFNRWHGSPWHFETDGKDRVWTESDLKQPLGVNWKASKGADLIWQPMPFSKSMRIAYSKTRYGTGYYIIQRVFPGARLSSRPPWGEVPAFVRDMFTNAGADQSPKDCLQLEGNGTISVADKGTARLLELRIPRSEAAQMTKRRIRIWSDGELTADAPVPLFFGAATLKNQSNKRFLVRAIPMSIEYIDNEVVLRCQFPIPFYKSLRIDAPGKLRVRYQNKVGARGSIGYFYATYKDHGESKAPAVLLDVNNTTGHLVGTSIIFTRRGNLATLEGDPRIYFDGSLTPQVHGTGTEEWGGGGDYWSGQHSSLPLCGHPLSDNKIQSLYRFLLPDVMPFLRSCKFVLERGAAEHYESVVYWYGLKGSSLQQSDTLVPKPDHTVQGAFEYGEPTSLPARLTTRSRYVAKLDPRNVGVLLRRTFDYATPNQCANVFVDGQFAGTWFSAGSTLGYYSNPPGENDPPNPILQRSPFRLRQDEFLLPVRLTKGKRKIELRFEFADMKLPFVQKLAKQVPSAWSEIRYDVDCVVPLR